MPTAEELYDLAWRAAREGPEALGDYNCKDEHAGPGWQDKPIVHRFYQTVLLLARCLIDEVLDALAEEAPEAACDTLEPYLAEVKKLANLLERDIIQEDAEYKPHPLATASAKAAVRALRSLAQTILEACPRPQQQ